ncbi:MAG: UDP-N-acetylglucosamine acyltransferase [Acidimicrobiia bacterium]|nr:UDP-N-acetylglucosamine acyltransferase [Acidimicrobiia bacterium]NNK92524.1 UDP-N-acetylglucosamine acyltransferase [Acidimicrobiia bacterium]NNL98903.1 UDP-N-acetylglucosamine acyltransferase [Acidimicrobiia bacterium]
MGTGNIVMPFAVILGPCRIGDDNWFGPHVAVGTPAQYRHGPHPPAHEPQGEMGIDIGNRNRIREFVTVHQGSVRPTRLHDDIYLMAYAHVPHDAELEDGVTMANATQVGGHTWIGEGANIGLGVDVRQRSAIGPYAMVGMNSAVTRHVPPFAMVVGSPARVKGANRVGMSRSGFDEDTIERMDAHFKSGDLATPDWLPDEIARQFGRFTERATEADSR